MIARPGPHAAHMRPTAAHFCYTPVGTFTAVAGGTTRRRPKMGLRTETLVPPYVINQTLVQEWIWAFQVKSYLMVQESALYNEVLLFFPK